MPNLTSRAGTVASLTIRGAAAGALPISLTERFISADLSLSSSAITQLQLAIRDNGLTMSVLRSGLFTPGGTAHEGTQCDLDTLAMAVTKVGVKPGSPGGAGLNLDITAQGLGAHRMSTDRDRTISANISYADWVRRKAESLGLKAIVQPSYVVAATGNQVTNGVTTDSWSTAQGYAGKLGYLFFEVAGTVYFGQPTWLLAQTRRHKLTWKGPEGANLPLLEFPTCTRTADTPTNAAPGAPSDVRTLTLRLAPGTQIYPGEGIDLAGVPTFEGTYLVTDTKMSVGASAVVTVNAATAVNPKPGENPVAVTVSPTTAAVSAAPGVPARGRYGGQSLSASQIGYAVTIAQVAQSKGLVLPRAAALGIACAMQESHLVNLAGGDRDSVGLFQQRPSQGWGSVAQCRTPSYAAGKFYDELKRLVPDYATHSPRWEAIAKVQRPAAKYRDYYAQYDAMADALVAAIFTSKLAAPVGISAAPPAATPSMRALTGSQTFLQIEDVATYGPAHRVTSTTDGQHSSTSFHYKGQAVDFAGPVPSRDSAALLAIYRFWMRWAGSAAEIIYAGPGGGGIKNGKAFTYSAAVRAQHHDHVHVAFTPAGLRAAGFAIR